MTVIFVILNKNIPEEDEYGCSVIAIVIRNFTVRILYNMNTDRLKHDGFPMPNGAIHAILNRVGNVPSTPDGEIKQLIQKYPF